MSRVTDAQPFEVTVYLVSLCLAFELTRAATMAALVGPGYPRHKRLTPCTSITLAYQRAHRAYSKATRLFLTNFEVILPPYLVSIGLVDSPLKVTLSTILNPAEAVHKHQVHSKY